MQWTVTSSYLSLFFLPRPSLSCLQVVNRPAHISTEVRCREEGISYYRLNPVLSEKVDSEQNKSSILQRMILTTRQYLHSNKDALKDLAMKLRESNLTSTMTVT